MSSYARLMARHHPAELEVSLTLGLVTMFREMVYTMFYDRVSSASLVV